MAHLQSSQVDDAAEVLARAFFDDPAWLWAIPEDDRRAHVLPWFFRAALRYGGRWGEVHGTEGTTEGAAIWLPPERPRLDSLRLVRVGLLLMPLKAGLPGFARFLTMWRALEERHKRDVPPQHWYLWLLGVDPPRQRQGLGSALIQPILGRADQQGLQCYLDTTRERNLAFYRRHGFEVVHEGDFPRGGPHFWTLRREPKG